MIQTYPSEAISSQYSACDKNRKCVKDRMFVCIKKVYLVQFDFFIEGYPVIQKTHRN